MATLRICAAKRLTNQQECDRQGNIFTIADETGNNSLQHPCPDFFYVEPSPEDAARIRAQLEKDQKDLPTYEEVMAMSAAQTTAGTLVTSNESTTSITTTNTATVPPYSEVPIGISSSSGSGITRTAPSIPLSTNGSSTTSMPLQHGGAAVWPITRNPVTGSGAASTSRAAAAAATVTITNSMSNTSV